jgi:hypothetical protein
MNLKLSSVSGPARALWDDLVDRRLWPVAVVLLVAIVAVPVLLLKPAKDAPPPPVPGVTGASPTGVAFQPAVNTEGRKSSEIRKHLKGFARKNPFTPQGVNLSSAASAGTATPVAGTTSTAGSTTSGDTGAITGSGASGSTGGDTGTGSTGSPATKTKTFYYHYTVDVTFGKTGNEDPKTLTEFRALPSTDNPVVIFMGVRSDGETVVFLVSANATTNGDGTCQPSDTECTFLYMKKGDSQLIEAVDSTGAVTDYTLELNDINVKKTSGPEKASSSKSSKSATLKLRRKSRMRFRDVVVRGLNSFGY